jgi:hypothetical protein
MASITDYASLKTEVGSWINRSDLATTITGLVQLGEMRVYRDLRIRQMETALSGTISSGVLAVPSGYVEMKYLYVSGSPGVKLQRKDSEWIYANYPTRSADSKPMFFAREGTNFVFGPYPDSAYTLTGSYYKRLDALSDSNTTNWLITDAPDLILFATLCEAAPWLMNDERVALWEKKYDQIMRRIQRNDEQEEFSGSPLQTTTR